MFEKRWAAIAPQLFTATGTANGVVTINNASLFKVKQVVVLSAPLLPDLELEVKSVLNTTTLVVGPITGSITSTSDISAYLISAASIKALEQKRPNITADAFERAVYEEEPTVAKRVVMVDKLGNKYSTDNPFPVQLSDGSINIGTVNAELEVFLSHRDNDPTAGDVHDSIRIGDGTDELAINADGSINANITGIPLPSGAATEAKQDIGNASLTSIDTKLSNLSVNVDAMSEPSLPDNIMVVGTDNGTKTGNKFAFINNVKNQILATEDRVQSITYADFGTKNQRIVQIDYTSPTFPAIVAQKIINYSLVGTKYRRDSIVWNVI